MTLVDAVSLHAYWSTVGPTQWNGLRWRLFPRPGVPILVTECGRDRVRDGPNGTYLPSETGEAFGYRAQGVSDEDFLAELAAYDAELRADGVYGVVFTTSPDDEWSRKGFDVDGLADRCTFTNIGPHDLEGRSPQALAWAARAPIVKSVDQTAAIRRASRQAITIYRRRFNPAEQDDMLVRQDVAHLVGAIVEGLAGFRHPRLYVELLNEVGKGRREQYVRLAAAAAAQLRAIGLKVAGPSWATGDYDEDDWSAFVPAATIPGGASMIDWCPFAERDELPPTAYGATRDSGVLPTLICNHIADGLGDPGPWWRQLAAGPENKRASAHFWISKAGEIKQYVRLSAQAWSNGPKCKPDTANALVRAIVEDGINPNSKTVSIEHEGRPGDVFGAVQVAASRRLHVWLHETIGIPLDRTHVVGHYQFDSCTRARCPGPSFPWSEVLMSDPTPITQTVVDLQNETYGHAHALRLLRKRWQAAGYPQIAEGLDAAGNAAERFVSVSKGEK